MSHRERLHQLIAHQLCRPLDEVTDDAVFTALGADSLDGVELEIAVEDEFGIAVEEGAIYDAETVGQVVDVVGAALVGKAAA